MNITVDELVNYGKPLIVKDKEFFPAEAYVTPFLERLQKVTNDFTVKVQLPDIITKSKEENELDRGFVRVWVQAVLPPSYRIDNHDEVIGMVYGLDVRKPVVKFYRGGLNAACTNLCVFDPKYLDVQELEENSAIDYKPLDNILSKPNEIKAFLNKLHTIGFSRDNENINENLGKWVRNCLNIPYNNGVGNVKISKSTPIDAYQLLFEKSDSPYYVPVDRNTDMFNVYNAFTQLISNDKDKDIMNKCEKTLLLNSILDI